ncbi:MAG: TetR/AcrR family transcriptional regulator [Armatimonadetes bacterium]|nr:TetR/AcrR family transcriptional regulator [Armatimonadota bacterium]
MIEQSVNKVARRTNDPVATRAKILETSIRLFNEYGYHSVSFAQIAKATGFPKSLVAYHFGTKEELWGAVTAHMMKPAAEAMDLFLAGKLTVGELLTMRLQMLAASPQRARFVAWTSLSNIDIPLPLRERRDLMRKRIVDIDAETVRRCLMALALMDGWFLNRSSYALLIGEEAVDSVTTERLKIEIEKLIGLPLESEA